MPSHIVLHEGYSLTLYGMGDDRCRHSLGCLCFLECCIDLVKIISVDINYMEIKCFKLLIDRIWGTHILNGSVDLKVIIIYDHYKVVQFSVTCKHGSLPDLSFLDLPVSAQTVGSVFLTGHLCCKCHTDCCRKSLSERTG